MRITDSAGRGLQHIGDGAPESGEVGRERMSNNQRSFDGCEQRSVSIRYSRWKIGEWGRSMAFTIWPIKINDKQLKQL